jgi:hypothetical protein
MQADTKSRWVSQLKLFDPTVVTPTWERMPREIREQTLRLLARLLREHWASEHHRKQPREARDE